MTKIIITFTDGSTVDTLSIDIRQGHVHFNDTVIDPSYIKSIAITYHVFDEAGRD